MSFTIDDAAIRAQLHTDVQTAWPGLKKIHDSRPSTAPKKADLPRAFITLGSQTPTTGGRTNSMTQVSVPHPYTITLEAAWPTSGTIEAVKTAKAQALLTILTASNVYIGKWRRQVTGVKYDDVRVEQAEEPVYRVTVEFEVEVLSSP